VLGGDGLYIVKGYTQTGQLNYSRLSFTAFAFPDEWQNAGFRNPSFFEDYRVDFDPGKTHTGYGWERPDAGAILAYDAVSVTIYGYRLRKDDLQQGLTHITGHLACQGISGRIDFQMGDVLNKAVVMLTVDSCGFTQMAPIGNQFYQGQLSDKLHFCDAG
jgi:hypothetical protein